MRKHLVTGQDFSVATSSTVLMLIFFIGFFGYLMPALGYFTMIPGDLGDARFNSVILEHGYQWLSGQVSQLWSPGFFYPFERVLGLSDNHFGSFWSYGLMRWMGFNREMAYSGWFLVGTVLNFWVCWWVLKRAGFSIVPAGAGAFTFAFALPMLHQEGHAQMVYRFAIPLAIFAWYRVLVYRDLGEFGKAVFWCGVQFLCSIYLGVFLVYLLVAFFVAYAVIQALPIARMARSLSVGATLAPRVMNRWLEARVWLAFAVLACMAVVLLLRQYQQISSDYQVIRTLDDLRSMIPRFSSYLLADNSQLTRWVGAGVESFPTRSEHQLFFGIGVTLFAGLGVIAACVAQQVHVQLRVCVLTAALAFVLLMELTTIVGDFSLYLWLLKLPGLDAIRAVSRIILVLLLPLAVLVGLGFECLLRAAPVLFFKITALVLGLALLTAETVFYQPHHSAVQTWLDRQAGLVSLIKPELPNDAILLVTQRRAEPFYITELDAMIYAQDHHLLTLNGYSGSTPAGYAFPDPCVPPETRLIGYFGFRNVPEAQQQRLLARLKTVELEPCRQK